MSLIGFHRFLIGSAIVFCLGFAAWQLRPWLGVEAASGSLVLATVFFVLAAALAVYLARLRTILKLGE